MKWIRIVMVLILVVTIALVVTPQEVHAATKTWTGGTGVWSDGTNWSPEGVPASTDDIIIDGDIGTNSVVTLDIDFDFSGSLTIESDDTLVVNVHFSNNSGSIDINGTIHIVDNSGSISNHGTIDNSGSIDNYGPFNNSMDGSIFNYGTIDNHGSIDNHFGIIHNDISGSIFNYGPFDNDGTINNYGSIDNDISGTISNYGIITNKNGSTINNGGLISNSDSIFNYGTFNNYVLINNSGEIYNHSDSGATFNDTGWIDGNPVIDLSNTPPIATDGSYSITVDTTLDIGAPGVLENDNDPDGDPLTAVKDSDPSNGTVTLSQDGSFTYIPDTGFTGGDSFNYTASDGNGGTDTALVTITVFPSAPVEAGKKLDLDVIQALMKDSTAYHIGASMDGLPVAVTLHSAIAIRWVKGEGTSVEDITSVVSSFPFFPGHLRIGVPEAENYLYFQFVVVHDDNGTPHYGTSLVINEQSANWIK